MDYLRKMIFALCLGLMGCSPTTFFSSSMATLDTTSQERGLGGYVSDGEIQARLNVIYFEHDHVLHYRININVYEGRVLLTGVVPSQQAQEDAIRLAWQVPGVKMVMDETIIGDKRSLGEYGGDKLIMTKVNCKLFADSKVRSRNYEVVAVHGVVYLMGIASDQEELDRVINICQQVSGVQKVVSYVRLMDLHERRRRHLFNKRKAPTPLEKNKTEKEAAKNPSLATGSWQQEATTESVYSSDPKKKHV